MHWYKKIFLSVHSFRYISQKTCTTLEKGEVANIPSFYSLICFQLDSWSLSNRKRKVVIVQSGRFTHSPVLSFQTFSFLHLRKSLWLKDGTYSPAPPFFSVMDIMQGGGLGMCFLHHHLLPAGWNPKASHRDGNEIFEIQLTEQRQVFLFFLLFVLFFSSESLC